MDFTWRPLHALHPHALLAGIGLTALQRRAAKPPGKIAQGVAVEQRIRGHSEGR
jgi:predicted membrane-bound mannosyltransferase